MAPFLALAGAGLALAGAVAVLAGAVAVLAGIGLAPVAMADAAGLTRSTTPASLAP